MHEEGSPPKADEDRSLLELFADADPVLLPEKSDHYFKVYDELFAPLRHQPLNILEIGIYHGGSTLVFAKYFDQARILAVDIEEPPAAFYDSLAADGLSDRVKVVMVSQSDDQGLTQAIRSHFGDQLLDLVIDDASHLYAQSRATFDIVFGAFVRPGGIYIVEDWGCGYWATWPDGDKDGRHGLPRLVKELVDLVALGDRTMLFEGRRTLEAPDQLLSPISRAAITNSIAAFFRSEAPMPPGPLVWPPDPVTPPEQTAVPETPPTAPDPLGLGDLLHQLPGAVVRAARRRWSARKT